MEVLTREIFFSKQGKASIHTNAMLFVGNKKRPAVKELNLIDPSDASQILLEIQALKMHEETREKKQPVRLSSAFRTISRVQHEKAFRNRTESPEVGLYTPRFSVIDPKIHQVQKFKKPKSKPREAKVLMPSCVNNNLQCTFPKRSKSSSKKHNQLNRTLYTLQDYSDKLQTRTIEPMTPSLKVKSPIKFKDQRPRDPFVSPSNPPNEKRFDHITTDSHVYSKNKRARTVSFSKMLARKELIDTKFSVGPYDAKEEVIRPRLTTDILSFTTMLSRKTILNKHNLATPISPELEKFDKAFYKQSTVRGIYKIPLMEKVSPRDQIMHRTNESFSVNRSKIV